MNKIKNFEDLEKKITDINQKSIPEKRCIRVCSGTDCRECGCLEVFQAFVDEINAQKLNDKVDIKNTGCHGFCERGPIVVIEPDGIFYQKIKVKDVQKIVSETVLQNKVIKALLYTDPKTREKVVREEDVPFYKMQLKAALRNCGLIDPESIGEYIAKGGYRSLHKVLASMNPDAVIEEVTKSGLRGRGGGGFLTGEKWFECRHNGNGAERFVICNAAEGDPKAYSDRSILEGNPHSVIEGMLIGAYAIGASQGYNYVNPEYPMALTRFRKAVDQAFQYGLLGKDILGTDFTFNIRINRGGGGFLCGESTALMASLEGKVGEPREKYIHATEKGLWNKPTALNNVETWANVPVIIEKGSEWFSGIGTQGSKGTKVFSLTGKVKNRGLVEVPMGTSLETIINEIGGGILNKKKLKAVQTGGPSGGCIPASLLSMPVDFEELIKAGSIMGSGGMIVMDEDTCMIDTALHSIDFLKEESCGKCVPCREGLFRMGEILHNICEGKGVDSDIEVLERLAGVLRDTSLCAFGDSAPNSVSSTIKYFRDEYEKHITYKKCPAGICKPLIGYSIDKEKCTGCGACLKPCPVGAIAGEKKQAHTLNRSLCTKCRTCYEKCKFNAIVIS